MVHWRDQIIPFIFSFVICDQIHISVASEGSFDAVPEKYVFQFDNQCKNEINDNIILDYEDFKYQGFEEEEKLIEQSMKSYEKENELYDQRSKEKLHLEQELNEKLAKSAQIEKYQKYEDQMTDFHATALAKDQNKMIENQKTKSQLESDIESLTEKIGDKETALDLRRKFEEIHTELGRKLEEKLGVEKIKTNLGSLTKISSGWPKCFFFGNILFPTIWNGTRQSTFYKAEKDISVSKAKANINDEVQKYNWWVKIKKCIK